MLIEFPRTGSKNFAFHFQCFVEIGIFSDNWKVAVVKMIPKPGKTLTKAESYRALEEEQRYKAAEQEKILLEEEAKLAEEAKMVEEATRLAEEQHIREEELLRLD
ncbi:hypothetical protein EVAR_72236_1 [Eumeta japonica]|uniref:Uncharacterized protein n=1 Tax=Eumeta variegata TaxID=151549 RepID=A0A4C1TGT3_EUMVA|nr:hypothetical protein EVAR_72236_1 [Eumeta japonica]